MNTQGIVRQYAKALFAVASAANRTAEVHVDLGAVVALVADHPTLAQVFASPTVPARQKRAIVDALVSAAGPLSGEVARLLTLLADRDRLALVGDVAQAYADRLNERDRVMAAQVVTAVEVSAERHAALAEALGQATGCRVTVTGRVDPSILGGVIAQVGGVVFDGSVANQLERLRQRLAASV